jgi:hypothetical protein
LTRNSARSLSFGVSLESMFTSTSERGKYATISWKQLFPVCKQISATATTNVLKGILLHLVNSAPFDSGRSVEVIQNRLAHRVDHPAYSLDLAPSEFLLLGMPKILFKGRVSSDRNKFLSLTSGFSMGSMKNQAKCIPKLDHGTSRRD